MKNMKTVYILIGTERSGSSFLSHLIVKSGGNFSMNMVETWYRGSGAYEHNDYIKIMKFIYRSLKFKPFSQTMAAWQKRKAVKQVKHFFEHADFAKYPPLSIYSPGIVREAGFEVKIILTFRKFEDFARSIIIKNYVSYQEAKETYINFNRTALFQLLSYGGCAISYETLMDLNSELWANSLGSLCNLSPHDLLNFRKHAVYEYKPNNYLQHDDKCLNLYNDLLKYEGVVVSPDSLKLHKSN